MDNENRAKQFLPFDALSGFREALYEKEIEHEAKIELSEEQIEIISQDILKLEEKEKVIVKFYDGRKYEQITGILDKIDYIKKKIIIGEIKINFSDILQISGAN